MSSRTRMRSSAERNRHTDSRLQSSNQTSFAKIAAKFGVSFLCGAVFGVATEKGKVFVPEIVTSQMAFEKFIMLKMFLSALTSGMFALSVLSMLPFTRKMYLDARATYYRTLSNKGFMSVCVGGFLFGAGLAFVGTCPGLLFTQIGTGTQNVVGIAMKYSLGNNCEKGYTCLGVFLGTVVYGLTESFVSQLTKPNSPLNVQFVNQWYESPYFVLTLPLAAFLSLIVFSLELFYPSSQELGLDFKATAENGLISAPAWPPYFCGCLVGSLQIPLVLVMKDTLGGSSFYCTLVSQGLVTDNLKKLCPYLAKFQSGFQNWWQVIFFGGTLLGSFLSSKSSGTYGTVAGVSPLVAVAGGFFVIFGARLANGCTSGHGLSGFGMLNILSIAATVCIFAGGVVTTFALKLIM